MPKRLIWFLVLLTSIIGLTVVMPIMERMKAEGESTNSAMSFAPFGYRALYRLCQNIDRHPVALWSHSLMSLHGHKPQMLWFVEPGEGLFFDGEKYNVHMRDLVAQGSHLIFVVDEHSLASEKPLKDVLANLNRWYGLSLKTHQSPLPQVLSTVSYFPSRKIDTLFYLQPVIHEERFQKPWLRPSVDTKPVLSVFTHESAQGAQVLLETEQGEPLILRFPQGKGSLTVFPNSFYFSNAQLAQGDNASLAVALSEINATSSSLFEVYSSGFNENRDFISYLATGKGIALLITLLLLLVCFCVWIVYQPVRKMYFLTTSDERYFTQEVFIDSLATHYVQSADWTELYQKLALQLQQYFEQKYPGLAFEAQLERIAKNPFYNVSIDALEAVFAKIHIAKESEFIQKSQRLLEVQRKVHRYEQQSQFNSGRTPTAAIAD